MTPQEKLKLVPINQKCLLSLDEAVAYTGLGRHTLIDLAEQDDLGLVVWTGRKRLYKRKKMEEYIDGLYSV